MKAITPQGIWDLLDKQDDDSKIAWKNEDLKLDGILKWIDDHPQEGDSEAVEKNSKL